MRSHLVPVNQYTGNYQLCLLVDGTIRRTPVARVEIDCPYFVGTVKAMVMDHPVYDLILGNIPGMRAAEEPDLSWKPRDATTSTETETEVGSAVITRSAAKKKPTRPLAVNPAVEMPSESQQAFALEQKQDATLARIWKKLEEGHNAPRYTKTAETRYVIRTGLLYRLHIQQKGEQQITTRQVILPKSRRISCMQLAHAAIMGGHMGIQRTLDRITSHFYWPGIQGDVSRYCQSCDICQRTTPKGRVCKVPLGKMPIVGEPFQRVAVDLVGPITPSTERGNRYILTLVDYATRYPEAIALANIDTSTVAEALLTIYSRIGFPEEVLSDMGTQFTSGLMREICRLISVRQLTSTPYHPMCNGLVERFNGTLKTILKRLSAERPKDWDRYLPAVLFAYREVEQESTGYSPFELLYGRKVRGPMHILKELWTKEQDKDDDDDYGVRSSYQYVIDLRSKIEQTCRLAQEALRQSQQRQKRYYDRKARPRKLKPGDWALILLPTDHNKLLLQWKGPFQVIRSVAADDYRLEIKGKQKTFHINMLKRYVTRVPETETEENQPETSASVLEVSCGAVVEEGDDTEELSHLFHPGEGETYLDVNYDPSLTPTQRQELEQLVYEFQDIFTDRPHATTLEEHCIDLTTEEPIRQKPYPLPYAMRDAVEEEIKTMLEYDVIERSNSPYGSPVVLVKKPDNSIRFCIDFRKLNRVTVFNREPMPSMEDIFSKLHDDVYMSKLDLSKGFWQIPMREEDKAKTAFVTPDGHFQFKKMPFGLVNATATFNRLMRKVLCHISGADSFVDDVLTHTPSWEAQIRTLRECFMTFRRVHLSVRPTKCYLGFKALDFIGHHIGEGSIHPQTQKVQQIVAATPPKTKREVRSFLGLVGYYRDFIPHFSSIATPLTDLTRKDRSNQVEWKPEHQKAFDQLRDAMNREPILKMPDFSKTFILQTDASENGAGAGLMQEHQGVNHPVAFCSRKFLPREKRYSVIERECLALVWAVQKFQKYLYGVEFILETDHQPLVFLDSAKFANSRIMRWSLFLQGYRFTLRAIKGKDNIVADYLSRVEGHPN